MRSSGKSNRRLNRSTCWQSEGNRGPVIPAFTMIGMSRSMQVAYTGYTSGESTLTCGKAAGGEERDRREAVFLLGLADLAHRLHHVVGVDLERREDSTGMTPRRFAVVAEAEESGRDSVFVHLAERDVDRVGVGLVLLGDVLEHVLRGNVKSFLVSSSWMPRMRYS